MFILICILFILLCIGFIFLLYRILEIEKDIEVLYDYYEESFKEIKINVEEKRKNRVV